VLVIGDAADALPLRFVALVILAFVGSGGVRGARLPLASVASPVASVLRDEADNVVLVGAASLTARSGFAASLAIVVLFGGVTAVATLAAVR